MIDVIRSKDGTPPGGHYSQGIVHNGILYTAGQVPVDPETKELRNESIEQETRQTLSNLEAVAKAAGTQLSNALKVTVYLTDMNDFPGFNKIYAEFFPNNPPARSTIQIVSLLRDVHIEIDAIIAIP